MQAVKEKQVFERIEVSRDEALGMFQVCMPLCCRELGSSISANQLGYVCLRFAGCLLFAFANAYVFYFVSIVKQTQCI